jgi:1-acyl-sn-glycerol-3-phosphate acyltransferase
VPLNRTQRDEGIHEVPFTIDTRVTRRYRAYRWLCRSTARIWCSPTFTGLEHVPATGPVILAPVHRSLVDFAFPTLVTDRKLFFMAKDDLWRSRLLGRVLAHLGAFPVHRESADRESLYRAQEILEREQVLVLFPEGGRFAGPALAPLMEGAAFLAARTGARIVPVGIAGSDAALPKGSRLPRHTRVQVVVGESVPPAPKRESGRVSRSGLTRSTEELREALQNAFDEARRLRAIAA